MDLSGNLCDKLSQLQPLNLIKSCFIIPGKKSERKREYVGKSKKSTNKTNTQLFAILINDEAFESGVQGNLFFIFFRRLLAVGNQLNKVLIFHFLKF